MKLLMGVALGLLVLVAVPGRAEAAADVRVIDSRFASRFPQGMTFSLEAAVLRPIAKVTLSYRVAGRRALTTGDAHISQATGRLRAESAIELARRYLPPGTTIQFYWQVEDDRGEQFRSETYTAVLEDGRFQWRQARAPNLELFWYRGGDEFGRALMQIAVQSLAQLARDTGVTLERPAKVIVYHDIEEFRSASFRGGVEWVGGTFYPREGIVLIYAPANQQGIEIARRAIPHELTHAVVHQVTDNPFGDVPQWLNEGLATRSEPQMSPDQVEALAKAVATNKLMSLRALNGTFPVDPDEALVAYAQSSSAVTFVLERYGHGRLNALLRAYREGVTYDDGLRQALGVDTIELDAEWRAWLAPWPFLKATPFAQLSQPAVTPTSELVSPERGIVQRAKELADSIWGQR